MTVTTIAELPGLVGEHLGTSRWFEATEHRVEQFLQATAGRIALPSAVDHCSGGPIAPGFMTLSLLGAMWGDVLTISDAGMVVNYGVNKVRFSAPVPVGSRLRLTAILATCESVAGGVQITADAVIEHEGGSTPVCAAEPVFRIYPM